MAKGRFAIGAIVGAVAGVIAGLLTAPKSGKETRADLKLKASELKEEATQRADDVRVKAGELTDEFKDKAEDLKERGERAIEGARKSFYDKKDS